MLRLLIFLTLVLPLSSCSRQKVDSPEEARQAAAPRKDSTAGADNASCLEAAQKALGPKAEVLKCGHLGGGDYLETVAATRIPYLKDDKHGIPISKLVVLRRGIPQWVTELKVENEITNPSGYVGIDFIDDSTPVSHYRVDLSPAFWGSRGADEFTIVLTYMTQSGNVDEEELPIAIGWNRAVGRFQEIAPNGEEFVPEVKVPKHIHSRSNIP